MYLQKDADYISWLWDAVQIFHMISEHTRMDAYRTGILSSHLSGASLVWSAEYYELVARLC